MPCISIGHLPMHTSAAVKDMQLSLSCLGLSDEVQKVPSGNQLPLMIAGLGVSAILQQATLADTNGPMAYYPNVPGPQVCCQDLPTSCPTPYICHLPWLIRMHFQLRQVQQSLCSILRLCVRQASFRWSCFENTIQSELPVAASLGGHTREYGSHRTAAVEVS